MKSSIFSYERPYLFLNDVFEQKKALRPAFSMRQFATFLGISDSGTLSRVLAGKRALTLGHAQKVVRALELSPDESMYLYQMTLLQEEREEIRLPMLHNIRSILVKAHLSDALGDREYFKAIADYRYLATWECLRLKDFDGLPSTLGKVWKAGSVPNFSVIFEKLANLGLISRVEEKFELKESRHFVLDGEERDDAIRCYHSGWLQVATQALDDLPTKARSFHGTTMAIPRWAYKEVVRQVTHMHQELLKLSVQKDADQVIHIGSFVVPVAGGEDGEAD